MTKTVRFALATLFVVFSPQCRNDCGYLKESREAALKKDLHDIRQAIDNFYADNHAIRTSYRSWFRNT